MLAALQSPIDSGASREGAVPGIGGIGRYYVTPNIAITGELSGFRSPTSRCRANRRRSAATATANSTSTHAQLHEQLRRAGRLSRPNLGYRLVKNDIPLTPARSSSRASTSTPSPASPALQRATRRGSTLRPSPCVTRHHFLLTPSDVLFVRWDELRAMRGVRRRAVPSSPRYARKRVRSTAVPDRSARYARQRRQSRRSAPAFHRACSPRSLCCRRRSDL